MNKTVRNICIIFLLATLYIGALFWVGWSIILGALAGLFLIAGGVYLLIFIHEIDDANDVQDVMFRHAWNNDRLLLKDITDIPPTVHADVSLRGEDPSLLYTKEVRDIYPKWSVLVRRHGYRPSVNDYEIASYDKKSHAVSHAKKLLWPARVAPKVVSRIEGK